LLLRRAERGDQNSGAWVFPGGIVDRCDRDAHPCANSDDAAASALLGVDTGGLDYAVAAIRECFEECGLLFAVDPDGRPVDSETVAALQTWRGPVHRGERTLHELCSQSGLRLAADQLGYLSHWVTPVGRAKRFDTRFFVAAAPAGQHVAHDGTEMLEHQWLTPADALKQASEGLKLMNPTRITLKQLAGFESVDALVAWARTPRVVPRIEPRLGTGARGERPVLPDEHAWAELGRLDPEGRATACYDIQPGVAVGLSPRLIRVSANNGSVMTGPGTNTYLVGGGTRNEWAVIDPGPADTAHVDAVLAAAPGPIRWIFVTHTHVDHSPATVELKARTGAVVHGRVAAYPDRQDPTFAPDRILADGERIAITGDATLRAIHTPGHASNHLCYLLEEERTLFTGDHVMQSSTVVINPPDGDMAAYIASLRALAAGLGDELEWLAPGHGFLMHEPRRAFERIVAHRLKREAKVVEALTRSGPATPQALLASVYDDVLERMHPVALRSLLAHLIKLRDDGLAIERDGRWSLTRANG
jgi:glyoxylase-like metal-dependent hydrolase (beta-lactamase superfamily II)/8-oxo-dGTP pyrophosphatase MutT (NUDIX family)